MARTREPVRPLTILCVLATTSCLGSEPPAVEVFLSDGHAARSVPSEHAPRLERALRGLLSSCSSNNTDWAGTSENWHAAEAAPSVSARYRVPIRVSTMREEIEVDAILFAPLSADQLFADHVFARRGDKVYAFAKWRPEASAELICDAYAGLERNVRIQEFCDMMHALRAPGP